MKKNIITFTMITVLVLITGCHKKENYEAFEDINNKHWTCAHGAAATTVTVDKDLLFIEEESKPNVLSILRLSEKEKNLFELHSLSSQEIESISKHYPKFKIVADDSEFNYLKVRANKTIDFAKLKELDIKDFLANDLGHGCELTESIHN